MKKDVRRIAERDVPLVGTHLEQTEAWVAGKNVHVRVGSSWECCPDFSCCYPDCAVSPAVRRRFAAADARGREKYYGQFLAALVALVSDRPARVHVVGQVPRGRQGRDK